MPAPPDQPAPDARADSPVDLDELDERKAQILRAVVTEYVAAAEPVGSQRVVEAAGLDVSSATVRNEMAALEEAGFVSQPHTSAGRVPTDRGYRYFVDDLRRRHAVHPARREAVAELLGSATDLEDLLVRTTHVVAQLTHLVSLVIAPGVERARLKLVELVDLTPQAVLVLLVTDSGHVEKRLLELHGPVSDSGLQRARAVLNEQARGARLADLEGILDGLADESPPELRELLAGVAATFGDQIEQPPIDHVLVGGTASLAGERAIERDQLSQVLELLEERVTLARLLTRSATEDEPAVWIGAEHGVDGLKPTALVAQRYRLVSAGSVGVLGPTRMDYAGVLATVQAVADQLQESLRNLDEA